MSDVGLINSGYQLTIRGESKKLRLDSWTSHDYRTHRRRRRLRARAGHLVHDEALGRAGEADKAAVRGKIWQRGETEPKTGRSRWSTTRRTCTAAPACTATRPTRRSISTTCR